VGVAGLPIDIVKSDLHKAKEKLQKEAKTHPRPGQFQDQLERVGDAAGPPGWIKWLPGHAPYAGAPCRRIVTYNVTQGSGGKLEPFCLILPRAPELTEVQGWVYAGGQAASSFAAPAEELLARLSDSTCAYLNGTARLLIDLWKERKGARALIRQPADQWREPQGLIKPIPSFNGYDLQLPGTSSEVREVAVSDEVSRRMLAAGITVRDVGDVRPSFAFGRKWSTSVWQSRDLNEHYQLGNWTGRRRDAA